MLRVYQGSSGAIAISAQYQLWAWGTNYKGELGQAQASTSGPVLVDFYVDFMVTQAALGFRGHLVQTDNGSVYECHGQT